MSRVDADIDALREFHAALVRYRYGQQGAVDRDGDRIETARAALAEKADRWRAELDRCRAEYEDCRRRAADSDGSGAGSDDNLVDCSRLERAVAEAEEHIGRIRGWQLRIEGEASIFHDVRGRFRDLLDYDLPRAESHLTALITRLEAARAADRT
jgi:hypothetical protein